MKNFKGKTAFITGGASGLGLGIAKAFARAGMNIVIADFRQEAIDAVLPIFKANSWPVHGVLLDVTDREAYVRAADEAERVFGKIHILVNNAGVGIMEGFIWEASYEDMDFALEINFKSVLNGIKTILPRILAHGEMETLAIDLQGTNVGASVFCPGPFRTNLGATTDAISSRHLGRPFVQKGATPDPNAPKVDMSKVDMSKMERDPEEAGERVLRGILRGDLFIFTHAEWMKGWLEHADAVTRAIPDEVPDELFMKVFSRNVGNAIYNRQQPVPAFEPGEVFKEIE